MDPLPLDHDSPRPIEDDDPDGIVVPGAAAKVAAAPNQDPGPRVARDAAGGGPPSDAPLPPRIEPPRPIEPPPIGLEEPEARGGGDDEDGITIGPELPAPPVARERRAQRDPLEAWKPALFGASIDYQEYVKRDGTVYKNYTILCTRHPGCKKTKGRSDGNMRRHGELQPLAFLHAWLDM